MGIAQIAITTFEDDLHALLIQKALSGRNARCHIIEANRISGSSGLNWSPAVNPATECTVPTRDGKAVRVRDLCAVWWRRVNVPQYLSPDVVDPSQIEVINNDCKTALLGIFLDQFRGTWINHPTATTNAENKLIQLRAAQKPGFRIPRTIVSRDHQRIRSFYEEMDGKVIVKVVRGSHRLPLYTMFLTPQHLQFEDSLRICPAIYQEYIPGGQHIRALCIGDEVYAALIESRELDWRENLNVPIKMTSLGETANTRLRRALENLGLKMGVVDLKMTPDGELVWLEINPQGQFLFLEGLTDFDLISPFTDFLYREAQQVVF